MDDPVLYQCLVALSCSVLYLEMLKLQQPQQNLFSEIVFGLPNTF